MIAVLWSVTASAGSLDIGEGTWELGGHATANIVLDEGRDDVYLDLSPTVGYFVSDHVELLGGVSMYINEGVLGVGFFAGLDGFFGKDGIAPYLGGTIGYGVSTYPYWWYEVGGTDVVTLSGRGGIVIPLNRKVGFDLGVRVNFNVEDGRTWIHIPLGYVGIRAFF